ncbi:MAG: hypothetical protein M1828_005569 [Chrysothrix sp. TS-e1954]|nr:MAG: hypothetical protein M1828_005569 [Chrysothrix sp. TS-e1954]
MTLDRYREPRQDDYSWAVNCGSYHDPAEELDMSGGYPSENLAYSSTDPYNCGSDDVDSWNWNSSYNKFEDITRSLSRSAPLRVTSITWSATCVPTNEYDHSTSSCNKSTIRQECADRDIRRHNTSQRHYQSDRRLSDQCVSLSSSLRAKREAEWEHTRRFEEQEILRRERRRERIRDYERQSIVHRQAERERVKEREREEIIRRESKRERIKQMEREEIIRRELERQRIKESEREEIIRHEAEREAIREVEVEEAIRIEREREQIQDIEREELVRLEVEQECIRDTQRSEAIHQEYTGSSRGTPSPIVCGRNNSEEEIVVAQDDISDDLVSGRRIEEVDDEMLREEILVDSKDDDEITIEITVRSPSTSRSSLHLV